MSDVVPEDAFERAYAEYKALPEGTKAEVVAGEVRVLPRPRPRNARAAGALGTRLGRTYGWDSDDGPGGWVLLPEPELRLGDQIRAPDLGSWRVERYVEPEDNPIELVPDWVCEILSPTTAKADRTEKMPLYAEHGVAHLWIVDPVMKTLEVYRREGALWVVSSTHAGDDEVCAEPFGERSIDLGALWRMPTPR